MEQKELIHSVYINGTTTMRTFFQALLKMSNGAEDITSYLQNKYSAGETNLYKLLNQRDPVSVQFLSQKVDLNKVRSYLGQHSVSFAFQEDDKGVRMYFKAKDEKLIAKALRPIINEVSADLGAFSKKILKKPGTMSFKEKVEYAQKHQSQYKGSIKQPAIKAPIKK